MGQHFVPKRTYYGVFVALIILTGTTVWAAFIDMGALNDVAALTIAMTKATLVILYFMHARYSGKLTWAFIAAGILFLVFLLAFTMSDILTRDWTPPPSGWSAGPPYPSN